MMKFYAVIAVAAMLSLSVLVVVSPASYAFKAYNVNLNRTIDLPIELAYPKTTIQPGYLSCGTDTFETIHNVASLSSVPILLPQESVNSF